MKIVEFKALMQLGVKVEMLSISRGGVANPAHPALGKVRQVVTRQSADGIELGYEPSHWTAYA